MRPRWVIARKELAGVFRERTILLAVLIQVFVAGFSSFLVVGLSALVDPSSLPNQIPATAAVAGSEDLAVYFQQGGMRLYGVGNEMPSAAEALAAFERGDVDVAVIATEPANRSEPLRVTLYLPDGDVRSTLTLVQAKSVLERYERILRMERQSRLENEPIVVDTAAKSGSFTFVYSLLIPLLVFLPIVLAGALTADSLTEEVQRGTLPILLSSPATAADVVEGKLLANAALAPLLAVAWFGLLALNGLPVPLLGAALILVLASAIAAIMGLLACVIALATRDRNKAHVIYATAMFFLIAASLALPVSPVNAVALLAAGSASPQAYALVALLTAIAAILWLAMRVVLRRRSAWLAAGGA